MNELECFSFVQELKPETDMVDTVVEILNCTLLREKAIKHNSMSVVLNFNYFHSNYITFNTRDPIGQEPHLVTA